MGTSGSREGNEIGKAGVEVGAREATQPRRLTGSNKGANPTRKPIGLYAIHWRRGTEGWGLGAGLGWGRPGGGAPPLCVAPTSRRIAGGGTSPGDDHECKPTSANLCVTKFVRGHCECIAVRYESGSALFVRPERRTSTTTKVLIVGPRAPKGSLATTFAV